MLRASIAAEAVGIPSVSVVCEGFEGQSHATARGHGFEGMRLGVLNGHVDAQSADEMIASFVDRTVDDIVAGLTKAGLADLASGADQSEPSAHEIVARGSLSEIHDVFFANGWTDGTAFVPPTVAAVEAFLAPLGYDPFRSLGVATSSGRDLTIWSVAVNAVMAGCDPSHLPVLIAATQILADPVYGAEHSGNTTGADALMILSSERANELHFNTAAGALREGTRANTSIGRWLRLYLRNVFGFTADQHDKATFGNSARVVLAEDFAMLSELGWPSIAHDLGVSGDGLTMARFNSGIIVGSVFGSTPAEILPYLGDGIARSAGWDLTHLYGLGHLQFRPLVVLSPVLARVFSNAGWSKPDVAKGLYEHARIPAWRFEKLIGEWSNLTAGRRPLGELVAENKLPSAFGESDDPERLVPVVAEPSHIMIAVAGDPNRTNAYVMANDGPHGDWTAQAIDWSPSADLLCVVPAAGENS